MIPGYVHVIDRRGRFLVREKYRSFLAANGFLGNTVASGTAASFPGGRCGLRLLEGDQGERLVVRDYRHGGIFRSLLRGLFIDRGRPIREVELMEDFHRWGIPTLTAVAGLANRVWPGVYRLRLITVEECGAMDLVTFLQAEKCPVKRRQVLLNAGRQVRRMHDQRVVHADLHPRNILVAGADRSRVLIIDLDRSRQVARLGRSARIGALVRLARFMWKNGLVREDAASRRAWLRFLKGYFGRFDEVAREEIELITRRLRKQLFLHRLMWKVEGLFSGQSRKG